MVKTGSIVNAGSLLQSLLATRRPAMDIETRKNTVKKLYSRLNERDHAVMRETMHETLKDHASHGSTDGLAAHEAFVAASHGAFSDLRFTVDALFGEGDLVCARGRMSGTNDGSFLGAPPSGRKIDITWNAIYRFEGDKIAERWLNGDDLGFMTQLGMVTPPGPPPGR
jgi:predicted ester cyclase